tara:strand:- start:66430 stop:67149 length:720 start_codon:yes stop_codon:yes gene_type:complete
MKYVFNWSGGKDSSLALWYCQKQGLEISKLLTTVSDEGRITMHGVENDLLIEQARKIGVDIQQIVLPHNCSMPHYSELMQKAWQELLDEGISNSVFGDIYLEDLRKYRDIHSEQIGVSNHYPIWKKDTKKLAQEFIESGFKTIIVCVDAKVLDKSFVGREYNQEFLNDLPEGVDPCGEKGEFHTYCYDGPIFSSAIKFRKLEVVKKHYEAQKTSEDECFKSDANNWNTGFWYQNLKLER